MDRTPMALVNQKKFGGVQTARPGGDATGHDSLHLAHEARGKNVMVHLIRLTSTQFAQARFYRYGHSSCEDGASSNRHALSRHCVSLYSYTVTVSARSGGCASLLYVIHTGGITVFLLTVWDVKCAERYKRLIEEHPQAVLQVISSDKGIGGTEQKSSETGGAQVRLVYFVNFVVMCFMIVHYQCLSQKDILLDIGALDALCRNLSLKFSVWKTWFWF
uniref:Uncharacterized protein n=1 Tax=Syphacia muris TaxID=451379 RepID=A0A0N5AU72_9BILA